MRRDEARHVGATAWNVAVGSAIGVGLGALLSRSVLMALVVWLWSIVWAMVTLILIEGVRVRGVDDRSVGSWALRGGTVVTAAVGLLLSAPALLLVVALLLAAPAARRRLRPRRATPTAPTRHVARPRSLVSEAPTLVVTGTVTDEDLWLAWSSSSEPQQHVTPEGRVREAEYRAILRGELARRRRRTGSH